MGIGTFVERLAIAYGSLVTDLARDSGGPRHHPTVAIHGMTTQHEPQNVEFRMSKDGVIAAEKQRFINVGTGPAHPSTFCGSDHADPRQFNRARRADRSRPIAFRLWPVGLRSRQAVAEGSSTQ